VLEIPLSRTHICSMHGENRVVEKLVHLHICKIWNMQDEAARAPRLEAVEKFLGGDMAMLLRGVPFKVEKCPKLSGKYGSTPMKPSFNDVKARKFTAHSSRRVPQLGEDAESVPGLWKKFLNACKSSQADLAKEKAVWEAWEIVVPFLRGEVYVQGDETRFRDAINAFTKSFVACWGEGHVTHYMHILYAHGPWLIKEHGSLGVWQCQGMEKSHWRARGNWQKHTSHDGGRQDRSDIKASSLYQLLRFDYRMLQGACGEGCAGDCACGAGRGKKGGKGKVAQVGRSCLC